MIELEKLKDELHQDRYAAVAVIYDRQEKKVLITGTGDDDILVKMMRKAIIENCKIRDAIKANANLVGGSPSDTDIFNQFNNLFGNPFRRNFKKNNEPIHRTCPESHAQYEEEAGRSSRPCTTAG